MSILKKIANWAKPAPVPPPLPVPPPIHYLLDDGHPATEIQTKYGKIISVYKGVDQWWNMTPDLKELQEQRCPAEQDKPVQKTPCTREEALEAAHQIDQRIWETIKKTVTDHDPLAEKAGYYIYGQHYYGERRALDAYTNYLRQGRDPKIIVQMRIDWCPHPDSNKGYSLDYEMADFTDSGELQDRELVRQRLAERWWWHMKDGVHRQNRYTPEEVFR